MLLCSNEGDGEEQKEYDVCKFASVKMSNMPVMLLCSMNRVTHSKGYIRHILSIYTPVKRGMMPGRLQLILPILTILILVFGSGGVPVMAQSPALIDAIIDEEAVTLELAAELFVALGIQLGTVEPSGREAFFSALDARIYPQSARPDNILDFGMAARAVMETFQMPAGPLYRVTRFRRYGMRELRYYGLFSPNTIIDAPMSGERLIQLVTAAGRWHRQFGGTP